MNVSESGNIDKDKRNYVFQIKFKHFCFLAIVGFNSMDY